MTPTLVQNQKRYHIGRPRRTMPPKGYRFQFSRKGMLLLLEDELGNRFYACPDGIYWNLTPSHKATLWDFLLTFGRLKIGSEYADTRTLLRIRK